MKRTCAWPEATRPGGGTVGATLSPPRPRRCAGSLVERARRKRSRKRGAGAAQIDLEEVNPAADEAADEILAVDEALAGLAAADPRAAELVKLRYFVGLSLPEAARSLGMAPRSADRLWAYARAWLRRAVDAP